MGVDARHAFFPNADIWRSVSLRGSPGCPLPDANLHGKWSVRPLSRAGRAITRDGDSGEASSPDVDRYSLTPIHPTRRRPTCKVHQVGAVTQGRPSLGSEAFAPGYGSCLLSRWLSFPYSQATRFSVRLKQEVLSDCYLCIINSGRTHSPFRFVPFRFPIASRNLLARLARRSNLHVLVPVTTMDLAGH